MKKTFSLFTFLLIALCCCSCSLFNPSGDIYLTGSRNYPKVSISDSSSLNQISKKALNYNVKDLNNNNVFAVDCFTNDKANLLVIPVWTKDSSKYISDKEKVRKDIALTYFGNNVDTGFRSVKTYYEELSKGQFVLDGIVSEWFEYDHSIYNIDYEEVDELLIEASEWYFSKSSSKQRTWFDKDKNGYIDGVVLIYGTPNYASMNIKNETLWAFTSWYGAYRKDKLAPTVNSYCFQSYDFMYGYDDWRQEYGYGDTSFCKLDAHTYIHETGHLFGLEDLYDYENADFSPAGGFTMQDYNTSAHDPFSVLEIGWSKPYIPNNYATIKIKPFTSSNDLILLPLSSFTNSTFDEYLLLEYYTPDGLNEFDTKYPYMSYLSGINDKGIRLWHIDARLAMNTSLTTLKISNTLTTNPTSSKYGVMLAMSNSSGGEYGSVMGPNYYDYNLVQLIHYDSSNLASNHGLFSSSSLFKKGSTFSFSKYSSQFANRTSMNNFEKLRWSFEVSDINAEYATITINYI